MAERDAVSKTLIIVESPAKAKTISKFLGRDYVVESSIGHIRDLPRNADEIPARYKDESWARLGLDVERDFAPIYIVPAEKRTQIAKLRGLVKDAQEVILATDEDREGEAIAWHLADELKPKVPVKRMVFHEITREAIQHAIANPRQIDENLVQAQEARRALDRLYGYEVSPVLWRKIGRSGGDRQLSAGRVQSVATRLLVERERERMRFSPAGWWDLEAVFEATTRETFPATLSELDGRRLATGKDFDSLGRFTSDGKAVRLNELEARALAKGLEGAVFKVVSTDEKPFTQRPYAPFITSTLQQEGNRKLGYGAQRTMRIAQRLYEGGYITYMRTDSTTLSKEALSAARSQVRALYGEEYLHPTPRTYQHKVKNAQEAHEAIRPAGDSFRTPQQVRAELSDEEFRLYDLIWKRTIASQMADARGKRLSARMAGRANDGRVATFAASGKTIEFPGFLRAYVEGSDDPEAALEDREVLLPALRENDPVRDRQLDAKGHTTQPPARFTEASLVQALEEKGIGRPSTYASIIQTIQDRGYVFKRGAALIPTFTAFAVVTLLERYFDRLVDYGFTAQMEEDLDEISRGHGRRGPYLKRFYFGEQQDTGLKNLIESRLETIDARDIATIPVPRLEGSGLEVRVGRYGVYMQRDDARGNIPDDLAPDELTLEKSAELMGAKAAERVIGLDPRSGLPITAKSGRFGPYVSLGESVKNASLLPGDKLEDITLERALQLLSLPREVGVLDGEEVWAFNGKFGPYLKKGPQDGKGDSRSLSNHDQLFTVTIEEARALFAQPKTRGRAQPKAPMAVYEYPERRPIQLLDGRFGPYLTDGELNAWLRANDNVSAMTAERALEIMNERGKPPKSKIKAGSGKPRVQKPSGASKSAARAKTTRKASGTKRTSSKARTKSSAKKSVTEKPAQKPAWSELEPFAAQFDPTTAQLLKLVNGQGVKMAEAATQLRITAEDAMARYRASNFKLYGLYRKAKSA
jgi:DNA topoisomerase-1